MIYEIKKRKVTARGPEATLQCTLTVVAATSSSLYGRLKVTVRPLAAVRMPYDFLGTRDRVKTVCHLTATVRWPRDALVVWLQRCGFRLNFNVKLNKANLRDLIAVTGLVISNWIQIVNFSARVTMKFDGWPRKTIGHFYTTSSFVHHFKSIGEFKLDLQSRNAQFG